MTHRNLLLLVSVVISACTMQPTAPQQGWQVDFFDDFEHFDPDNWQDQLLWVNGEDQCYVKDNMHNTREVSEGTLKLRVVNIGTPIECDNWDKQGNRHPPTRYVAGRIASKNRQEFVKGRWTARLRLFDNGQPGMFPAWWLLGAQNNEPPVQEPDETICWPVRGSGEIDIFEHFGSNGPNHYAVRRIVNDGTCDAVDWESEQKIISANLDDWHEYSVEWAGGDIIYRLDGREVHRNAGQGDLYPEPLFAILNYAKITDDPMLGEWVMEVDWVKHESLTPLEES